jgi:large subunit ribosomal protein L10
MAVSRAQKVQLLADLKDKMSKAQSIMFAHYIGMTVANVSDLRAKLKEGKAEMKVAKKTLMQIAAKDLNLPEISDEALEGPVACILSYEDPLSGAQIAFKFSKANPQVELIGGVFEGKLLTKEEAVAIAKIPGKQQLLGMFAGMINTPLVSFAIALKEIAKQKEQPAPAAETPKAEAAPAPAAEEKKEEAAPAATAETPATTEEASTAPSVDAPPAA